VLFLELGIFVWVRLALACTSNPLPLFIS
jgi:hypothetical protein